MPRPDDWSALGRSSDPTPGDADRIDQLITDQEQLIEMAKTIDQGFTDVLQTTNGAFVGHTADALRDAIDGKLRNYVASFRTAQETTQGALRTYVEVLRTEQRRADDALSEAAGLDEDDESGRSTQQGIAEDAESNVDAAAAVAAAAIREAASSIQTVIDPCDEFWKALQWIAIILIIPAILLGGPVALLAIGLNIALLIKTAVDFSRGNASVTELVLAIVGVIAPTTKGLNIGKLWTGLRGLGSSGINGMRTFFGLGANGFGLGSRLMYGMGNSFRAAAMWIRGSNGIFTMGPIAPFRYMHQAANFSVITNMGGFTFAAIRGAITIGRFGANMGRSMINGVAGWNWLRLVTPVAADEIAVLGLRGAARVGFIDRGLLGRFRYGYDGGQFLGATSKVSGVSAGAMDLFRVGPGTAGIRTDLAFGSILVPSGVTTMPPGLGGFGGLGQVARPTVPQFGGGVGSFTPPTVPGAGGIGGAITPPAPGAFTPGTIGAMPQIGAIAPGSVTVPSIGMNMNGTPIMAPPPGTSIVDVSIGGTRIPPTLGNFSPVAPNGNFVVAPAGGSIGIGPTTTPVTINTADLGGTVGAGRIEMPAVSTAIVDMPSTVRPVTGGVDNPALSGVGQVSVPTPAGAVTAPVQVPTASVTTPAISMPAVNVAAGLNGSAVGVGQVNVGSASAVQISVGQIDMPGVGARIVDTPPAAGGVSFTPAMPAPGAVGVGSIGVGGIAPGGVAPGAITPGAITPGAVVPGTFSPGAVATGTFAPGAVAPGAFTPGTVAPGSFAPGGVTPGALAPGGLGMTTPPVVGITPASVTVGALSLGISPGVFTPGALAPGSVAPGAVGTGALPPGAIAPGAVAPGGVTPGGLSGALTPGSVPSGAVTPGAIATPNVTPAAVPQAVTDLGVPTPGAVGVGAVTPGLTPGAVTPGAVTPGAVTPPTVTPGAVAPGAVAPGGVTPGAVTPGAVVPGAVTPGAVVPGAVTPGAVAPGGIAPGAALGAVTITPGSVTPGSVTPGSVTPGTATPGTVSIPGSVPGLTNASTPGSVTSGAVTPGSITSGSLTPGAVSPDWLNQVNQKLSLVDVGAVTPATARVGDDISVAAPGVTKPLADGSVVGVPAVRGADGTVAPAAAPELPAVRPTDGVPTPAAPGGSLGSTVAPPGAVLPPAAAGPVPGAGGTVVPPAPGGKVTDITGGGGLGHIDLAALASLGRPGRGGPPATTAPVANSTPAPAVPTPTGKDTTGTVGAPTGNGLTPELRDLLGLGKPRTGDEFVQQLRQTRPDLFQPQVWTVLDGTPQVTPGRVEGGPSGTTTVETGGTTPRDIRVEGAELTTVTRPTTAPVTGGDVPAPPPAGGVHPATGEGPPNLSVSVGGRDVTVGMGTSGRPEVLGGAPTMRAEQIDGGGFRIVEDLGPRAGRSWELVPGAGNNPVTITGHADLRLAHPGGEVRITAPINQAGDLADAWRVSDHGGLTAAPAVRTVDGQITLSTGPGTSRMFDPATGNHTFDVTTLTGGVGDLRILRSAADGGLHLRGSDGVPTGGWLATPEGGHWVITPNRGPAAPAGGELHVHALDGSLVQHAVRTTGGDLPGGFLRYPEAPGGAHVLTHLDGTPVPGQRIDPMAGGAHRVDLTHDGTSHTVVLDGGGRHTHDVNALPQFGANDPVRFLHRPVDGGGPTVHTGAGVPVPHREIVPMPGGGHRLHFGDTHIVVGPGGRHTHDVTVLTGGGGAPHHVHTTVGDGSLQLLRGDGTAPGATVSIDNGVLHVSRQGTDLVDVHAPGGPFHQHALPLRGDLHGQYVQPPVGGNPPRLTEPDGSVVGGSAVTRLDGDLGYRVTRTDLDVAVDGHGARTHDIAVLPAGAGGDIRHLYQPVGGTALPEVRTGTGGPVAGSQVAAVEGLGHRLQFGDTHIVVGPGGRHTHDVTALRSTGGADLDLHLMRPVGGGELTLRAGNGGPSGHTLNVRPDGGFDITGGGRIRRFGPDAAPQVDAVRTTGLGGAQLNQAVEIMHGGHTVRLVDNGLVPVPDARAVRAAGGGYRVDNPGGGVEFRVLDGNGATTHEVRAGTVDGTLAVTARDGSTFTVVKLSDATGNGYISPGTGGANPTLLDGNLGTVNNVTVTREGADGFRVTSNGGVTSGEFKVYDAGGKLRTQQINVLHKGALDGGNLRLEITHAADGTGTWKVAGAGNGLPSWYKSGTVDVKGAENGRIRLNTAGDTLYFERRFLPDGNHVDVRLRGDGAGPVRSWHEVDPQGGVVRHGDRTVGSSQRSWMDNDGFTRVRHTQQLPDGGHVVADAGRPAGLLGTGPTTPWYRYDADFNLVARGDRTWGPGGGFTDRMVHPSTGNTVTVHEKWGRLNTFDNVGQLRAVEIKIGGIPSDDFLRHSAHGKETQLSKALPDGTRLDSIRLYEQRPPAWWREMTLSHHNSQLFTEMPHLRHDGVLQVHSWRATPTGGGATVDGLRFVSRDAATVDLAANGELIRSVRKLPDGNTLTHGDLVKLPDGATTVTPGGGRPYRAWSEGDGNLTGHRTFQQGDFTVGLPGRGDGGITAGDIRWQDRFSPSATGGGDWYTPGAHTDWRVARTGLTDGSVVEYRLPPQTRATDDAGNAVVIDRRGQLDPTTADWTRLDHHGTVIGRADTWDGRQVTALDNRTWNDGVNSGPRKLAIENEIGGKRYWDPESYQDFTPGPNGQLVREFRMLGDGVTVRAWRTADGTWTWNKYDAHGSLLDFGGSQAARVREWTGTPGAPGSTWKDVVVSDGAGRVTIQEMPVKKVTGTVSDLLSDPAVRPREYHATPGDNLVQNLGEWKEFHNGTVIRSMKKQPDGSFLEQEMFHNQLRRYAPSSTDNSLPGFVIGERTVSGIVREVDTFGRITIRTDGTAPGVSQLGDSQPNLSGIGRDNAPDTFFQEYRGHNRKFKDPNRQQWSSPTPGESAYTPFAPKVGSTLASEFIQEWLVDFTMSLAVNGIVAAVNGNEFTYNDVLKALFGATVGATIKTSISGMHFAANRGGWRNHMSQTDTGFHPNRPTGDDNFIGEWAGREKPGRWRGATYEFGLGIASGAIGGLVVGSANAAIFGVKDANGNTVYLTGLDALREGGFAAASGVIGGMTTGLTRTVFQQMTAGRQWHRAGFFDAIVFPALGKLLDKSLGALFISPAVRLDNPPEWYGTPDPTAGGQ
ncbi:hypothetical protein [Streptomyces lonarensis]|uniref:Uncharacterized protein n=1 Tax=Streptomyces lonarensis TaxID=700599 RepID=A0A7X6HZI2_9ACTN|nr:hypothetical protein [Streptomyces lonarensis]NJQ06525.1 hypothetical protein [Streptomyces lonarensis]